MHRDTNLVAEVSEQQSFREADEGEEDLYHPQGQGAAHPDNGIPVYDRVFLKFFSSQVIGHEVNRLIPRLTSIAATKNVNISSVSDARPLL